MSDRIPVLAVLPVKNEAENIGRTIASVIDTVEAVVIVDSGSTDGTQQIARELGAEVVDFTWDGGYPKKKQWCLDHVRTDLDWVLLLDGDESPTPELLVELRELFARQPGPDAEADAYDIPLAYWFAGRELRHGYTVHKRSLLNRRTVSFPVVDDLDAPGIREMEGHYQPVAPRAKRLRARLEHRDLDPMTTWFDRHNRYSDWEAWLEHQPVAREQVRGAKTRQGRLFTRVPFKPVVFFLYAYLARSGFRDGRAGFDYALALSFYRWQIGVKDRELSRAAAAPGVTATPAPDPARTTA